MSGSVEVSVGASLPSHDALNHQLLVIVQPTASLPSLRWRQGGGGRRSLKDKEAVVHIHHGILCSH